MKKIDNLKVKNMQKIRLEISCWLSMGTILGIMGIFLIIMGATNSDSIKVVRGCAYIALGVTYATLGIERVLGSKLNIIHQMLGPYEVKKLDRFMVMGSIFQLTGMCIFIGAIIVSAMSAFGSLPAEYGDLVIALIVLSYAFSYIGKMHVDNNKYNDIYNRIVDIVSNIDEIKKGMIEISSKVNKTKKKIKKRIGKQKKIKVDDNETNVKNTVDSDSKKIE